ncbi:MAG: hypothetical protein K8I30_10915 [Anaerolineae bacterium]|nr:hypothetical protein [Anaerolineae bacterium]
MIKHWNLVQNIDSAEACKVFSGGACNILDTQGVLLRNSERDKINDWLTQQGIPFYDPQIHPDTHGREYDYELDHKLELAVRRAARLNLFEVSPRTFCGVTSIEIAVDQFEFDHPTIIFFSDGSQHRDVIPRHSRKGHPLFVPYGIDDSEEAGRAHYQECIKNANRMRQYLVMFAKELGALSINFSDQAYEGDVVVTPDRIHAVDIFDAVVRAADGKRVNVTFTGGDAARDGKGYPLFVAPKNPKPVDLETILDQYVDEGNALRRAICERTGVNVFTRVVYTQNSVIDAISELTKVAGLLV